MPRSPSSFVVKVDPSVQLSSRSRAELAAAMGGSAAAALARLDLTGKRTVAFIPRIDWPGGILVDLRKIVPANKLREISGGR
jgi:hypothetical protein